MGGGGGGGNYAYNSGSLLRLFMREVTSGDETESEAFSVLWPEVIRSNEQG